MRIDYDNPLGLKSPIGNFKSLSSVLDSAVFPGTQGCPLEHIIAAKAVSFEEALSENYMKYILQVKKNAKAMAESLIEKNYNIISNGTDNHLMLIDLSNKKITGKIAENTLVKADITINKNMVPFDDKSPFITSGIRVGTAAITTRGLVEKDIDFIIKYIEESLYLYQHNKSMTSLSKEVKKMMKEFPIFKY